MRRSDIQRLAEARSARRPLAMLTWLRSGETRLVAPGEVIEQPELATTVADGFRRDQSGIVRLSDGGEVFVTIHNPRLRMILVGAVHISQALIPLARAVGYDVVVIDPRTAFATAERFEGVAIDARWPDEALPEIGVDSRTAFVALTHDPKIDDPALAFALARDPFYIGALGSKKTSASRRERLVKSAVPEAAVARIHGPIGLDIGATGAAEIAISIMAEVTGVLRGRVV